MGKDSGTIENARDLAPAKQLLLGFQHLFTMFGSSVLVPLTTGLDISVVLFMNGLGTLLFHFMTKKKVPVFLGSSYAYITPVITVAAMYAADGLAYARGGILIAGVVYMLMSLVVWNGSHQQTLSASHYRIHDSGDRFESGTHSNFHGFGKLGNRYSRTIDRYYLQHLWERFY